jgi:hypothetical protein
MDVFLLSIKTKLFPIIYVVYEVEQIVCLKCQGIPTYSLIPH